MSRDPVLSLEQKQTIATEYTAGNITQEALALEYGVARRTIQRALIEMGVKHYNTKKPRIVTENEEAILTEVRSRGLSLDTLRQRLNGPRSQDICTFLTRTSAEDFTRVLSIVGYERMRLTAVQHMQAHATKRAANE